MMESSNEYALTFFINKLLYNYVINIVLSVVLRKKTLLGT